MNKKIYYGIAGYHRPECKTYHTLIKMGIPKERIVISLNDKEDYEEYKKIYKDEVKIIYKKGNNVACNRNNIINNFPKGSYVMVLDDDIISFKKWDNSNDLSKYGKLRILNAAELESILYDCFKETEKINNNLFGTYAIPNTMMIKETIKSQGLYSVNKMFQGGSCGFIVDKDNRYDESMLLLDDYEIILRNISEGKNILRRNDLIAVTPKMGTTKGGYYDIYKQGKQKEYLIKLKEKYPNMITIKKDYSGIVLKRGI